MKEAYIKAVGIGLGFELRRAEFHYLPDDDILSKRATVLIDGVKRPEWSFTLGRLGDDHWVSPLLVLRPKGTRRLSRGAGLANLRMSIS